MLLIKGQDSHWKEFRLDVEHYSPFPFPAAQVRHGRAKRCNVNTFDHLPNLRTLQIDNNHLETIDNQTSQNLIQLKSLNMSLKKNIKSQLLCISGPQETCQPVTK